MKLINSKKYDKIKAQVRRSAVAPLNFEGNKEKKY